MRVRTFCWLLLAAGALWAILAAFGWGGQRKAIYEEGREELYDFWMPMNCVRDGYVRTDGIQWSGWILPEELARGETVTGTWRPGAVFRTGWVDRVYPAFALLPFKFIPLSRTGGWCWSASAGILFLLSLVVCAKGKSWPLVFACSAPFIFNLERGNPVWLSAAAVAVFLAWWDDEFKWKRVVAAACLAVATALKLAPAALGLLYVFAHFGEKRPRGETAHFGEMRPLGLAALAGMVTIVLLVAPWIWMPDGFAGIPEFLSNARHHSEYVQRQADFGLVQLWRSVRIALGQSVNKPWPGMMVVARISQVFGFAALVLGAKRRDYLLLIGGMLLAAGNMYYYAALYLPPVLVLEMESGMEKKGRLLTLSLWFVLCCPLQVSIIGHSANCVLCNLATMALLAAAVLSPCDPFARSSNTAIASKRRSPR